MRNGKIFEGEKDMNDVTYGVTEEIYSLGEHRRVSYGIAAYADSEADGTATVVAFVRDITSDRNRLALLVEQCNCLGLSPIHLNDVIEDFLAE